ncbi:hypothetical protein FXO38_30828 [Capsicum annuum]|nr:hypothetical protein FXO38_30828 [Capsicum annuum]
MEESPCSSQRMTRSQSQRLFGACKDQEKNLSKGKEKVDECVVVTAKKKRSEFGEKVVKMMVYRQRKRVKMMSRSQGVKAITVLWKTPEEGWVKYNTDGAVRGEEGGSSYAFCLRNEDGDVLFAKEEPQHYADSMQAEANVILQAAKHCSQLQYNKIIIQTDSLLMQKIGHKSKDYRAPKKGKKKDQANFVESKKEMDDLCAILSECNLVGNSRELWINSGATRHVCANKDLFAVFALAQVEEKIYMTNSATSKVEGT